MQDLRGSVTGILAACVLVALLVIAGTAAAQDTGECPCEQWWAGNATAGYSGPGMADGFGYGMMSARGRQVTESLETGAMGGALHDEMEDLMERMMAGNLSAAEQSRMIEITNQYPAASNMMLFRMGGGYGAGAGDWVPGGYAGRYGMMDDAGVMGSGFMSAVAVLVILFFIVWFVAGILLILWLLQQLGKGKTVS